MHAVMRFARPTAPARRLARSLVIAALCLPWTASRAHAVTGALCLPNTLNGQLKVRATGVCKSHEIQIGSFNGTTLQFSGINVQVVSGSGTTDGPVNGKGNLIVGYNTPGSSCFLGSAACGADADCPADVCAGGACSLVNVIACTTTADCPPNQCLNIPPRTGSHNLVIGDQHSFTSYGGLVAGSHNAITAPSASITAGASNSASGPGASVTGGQSNDASGVNSSISGGSSNQARGPLNWIGGGEANIASGGNTSISGGEENKASGLWASVSGGRLNMATALGSSVSGGVCNLAGPGLAACPPGEGGSLCPSVSGGFENAASGDSASVSGGAGLTQPAFRGWAAGSAVPGNVVVGDFESP